MNLPAWSCVCVAARSLLYRARIPSGMITVNAVPTNKPAPRTVTNFNFCSDNRITSGILPAKYEPTNITTTNNNNTIVSSTIFVFISWDFSYFSESVLTFTNYVFWLIRRLAEQMFNINRWVQLKNKITILLSTCRYHGYIYSVHIQKNTYEIFHLKYAQHTFTSLLKFH